MARARFSPPLQPNRIHESPVFTQACEYIVYSDARLERQYVYIQRSVRWRCNKQLSYVYVHIAVTSGLLELKRVQTDEKGFSRGRRTISIGARFFFHGHSATGPQLARGKLYLSIECSIEQIRCPRA